MAGDGLMTAKRNIGIAMGTGTDVLKVLKSL
jgi:hypothetical protein